MTSLAQIVSVPRALSTATSDTPSSPSPPSPPPPQQQHEEEYIPGSPIRILRTIAACRAWTASNSQRPSLVPTMGALHQGHISLIGAAAAAADSKAQLTKDSSPTTTTTTTTPPIVVSIYVNPAQFGIKEDLDSYPKTWDEDCRILRRLHRKLQDLRQATPAAAAAAGGPEKMILHMAVFAPSTAEMYPSGFPGQEVDSKGSFVTITPVGVLLEGASRPTSFRGVATVCIKLFNIVQPDRVYFGQKDVQQTVVIKKMVRDLCMPVNVRVMPTVREASGLAMSSRNVYLGERRSQVATVLVRALRAAEAAYQAGEMARSRILGDAHALVEDVLHQQRQLVPGQRALFEVDYISLADPASMTEVETVDSATGAILSGAIRMLQVEDAHEGEDLGYNSGPPVRLIDNIILLPSQDIG